LKLSIFLECDHGALQKIVGRRGNAIQYEIGNPITASKMTRYCLAGALYSRRCCSKMRRVGVFSDTISHHPYLGSLGDDRVAADRA
jgi:hypothetical protein